jgi:hypothetical protein
MKYYIRTTERITYTKYLIAAETDALDDLDGDYLGYVDGETTTHAYAGPFDTEADALNSDDGYTEGQ